MLFNEYMSTVLLPQIARVRSNPGLENELAVLLMDDCSVHMHNDTLKELTSH
jgi:ABC-type arginine transport system permease subunit